MKKNETELQNETMTANTVGQCDVNVKPVKNKPKFFTAGNMAVMGILTAIAYVLYMLPKLIPIFNFPIFPGWLEFQVSDLPALLGGFALGPWAAVIIVVIKCLLKMPFTGTMCVGELADIIVGIAFTVPASLFYRRFKNKKGAIAGMSIGTGSAIIVSMLANWLVLVPFYSMTFGNGNYEAGLGMLTDMLQKTIFPWITSETFYVNYIFIGVLPFNALRCLVCAIVSFLVYKPLSKALHWEIKTKKQKLAEQEAKDAELNLADNADGNSEQ